MGRKIPTTVITGFLGAGKTTLIRNLLARAGGRRIALVINEFGDIGIDGDVLRGCGDALCGPEDIVELSNGCICCTVAEDFIPTIERLINRAQPPEHIVIETSGLALPQPLVRAFQWPAIRNQITVDGVVTLIDGPAAAAGQFAHDPGAISAQRAADTALDHTTPLAELFSDQLACADMAVISKTDLMAPAMLGDLDDEIARRIRPGVRIVHSRGDGLGPEILLGLGMAAETGLNERAAHFHDHAGHEDEHEDEHDDEHDDDAHDHDAFESFALTLGEIDDGPAFAARLARAIDDHAILRLKGFVAVRGKPMRQVIQAVGPRIESYFDQPFGDAPRQTRLVIIGMSGLDRAAISAAIAA